MGAFEKHINLAKEKLGATREAFADCLKRLEARNYPQAVSSSRIQRNIKLKNSSRNSKYDLAS